MDTTEEKHTDIALSESTKSDGASADNVLKRKHDNNCGIEGDSSNEPASKAARYEDKNDALVALADDSNITEKSKDSAENVNECSTKVEASDSVSGTNEDVKETSSGSLLDPLAYTKAEEFTSEVFKIQIHNLPNCGFSDLKKRLISLGLKPHKFKKPRKTVAYVCFRCEEDRVEAIKKANGHVWRGHKLEVKEAAPVEDPFLKRKQKDNNSNSAIQDPMTDGEAQQKLKDNVVPLWNMDYATQLEVKAEKMKSVLKKMTHNFHVREQFRKSESWNQNGMPCPLLPIIPSPVKSEYRNKNEFTIGYSHDGSTIKVGFRFGLYKNGTTCVGDCEDLGIVKPAAVSVVKGFETFVRQSKWKPYLQQTGEGHWQTLTVRTFDSGDVMAMVDFKPRKLEKSEIEEAKKSIYEFFTTGEGKDIDIKSFYFRLNGGLDLIFGEQYVFETLLGLRFRISPEAFFQVNTKATEQLYSLIGEWCEATSSSTLLDICCGTGTIGLSVAKNVKQVLAVEMCQPAVADAEVNAAINGISNVKYYCSKVEDSLSKMLLDSFRLATIPSAVSSASSSSSTMTTTTHLAKQEISSTNSSETDRSQTNGAPSAQDPSLASTSPTTATATETSTTNSTANITTTPVEVTSAQKNSIIAVVDPPRAGLHKNVIHVLRKNEDIQRLVYVSCNAESAVTNFIDLIRPSTSKLRGPPFTLERAVPVDLFPGTKHCELVLLFTRNLSD